MYYNSRQQYRSSAPTPRYNFSNTTSPPRTLETKSVFTYLATSVSWFTHIGCLWRVFNLWSTPWCKNSTTYVGLWLILLSHIVSDLCSGDWVQPAILGFLMRFYCPAFLQFSHGFSQLYQASIGRNGTKVAACFLFQRYLTLVSKLVKPRLKHAFTVLAGRWSVYFCGCRFFHLNELYNNMKNVSNERALVNKEKIRQPQIIKNWKQLNNRPSCIVSRAPFRHIYGVSY